MSIVLIVGQGCSKLGGFCVQTLNLVICFSLIQRSLGENDKNIHVFLLMPFTTINTNINSEIPANRETQRWSVSNINCVKESLNWLSVIKFTFLSTLIYDLEYIPFFK